MSTPQILAMKSKLVWLPVLLCLSLYPPLSSAESTAQKALSFATELREQAAAAVQKAQDRLSVAESDLRIAQSVLRDSQLANDKEAVSISEMAVTESRRGVADAQKLLQRARTLLAERERSVQDMRFWTESNRPVGALVVPVEGEVRVRRPDGTYRDTVLGAAQAGDRIETAAGGRARLFVADGSGEVQLNGNTAFTVVQDDVASGFLGELEYGYGRFIKGLRAKVGRKFEVRTPVAALAVRGTRFEVEAKAETTWVGVSEGVVAVTLPSGDMVEVAAGTQRRCSKQQGCLSAAAWDAAGRTE
ncbi:MAG: FecR family protein [Sideroxydans sp.]|nr:FecR family protein [Sideroxydans sp.]